MEGTQQGAWGRGPRQEHPNPGANRRNGWRGEGGRKNGGTKGAGVAGRSGAGRSGRRGGGEEGSARSGARRSAKNGSDMADAGASAAQKTAPVSQYLRLHKHIKDIKNVFVGFLHIPRLSSQDVFPPCPEVGAGRPVRRGKNRSNHKTEVMRTSAGRPVRRGKNRSKHKTGVMRTSAGRPVRRGKNRSKHKTGVMRTSDHERSSHHATGVIPGGLPRGLSECNQRFTPPKRKIDHGRAPHPRRPPAASGRDKRTNKQTD